MEAITPTPERLAKDEWIEVPTERAGVRTVQVVAPHVLDRYRKRGDLAPGDPVENQRRYDAGAMIRDAFEKSGLSPMVVGGYEPAVDGYRDPAGRLDAAVDAGRRWRRLMAYAGPDCFWTVYTVCCIGESCGRGVSMERLRRGLARVADEVGC
jgi:hypothetical protein